MTKAAATTIVWLRQDLRLADHPALHAASRRGGAVIPVFVWGPEEEGAWAPGGASRWWLHQSLSWLAREFQKVGATLILRRGAALAQLVGLAKETRVQAVLWNRRYEPAARARDQRVQEGLSAAGLQVETFNSALLHEPPSILNKGGQPFQVFTPFWKTCLASGVPSEPLPAPRSLSRLSKQPVSVPLTALELEPRINWAGGLGSAWKPGSAGAKAELDRFLREGLLSYSEGRNRPDLVGTSRLSPHLHFGEISPRQVWHAVRRFAESRSIPAPTWRSWQFLTELGWREFAHHLLYHFPHTPEQPLRSQFARFPWRTDAAWLRAWQEGRTGYPLVDAGMRELWTTGWMHNRVRMVVASFLVKNLLISWLEGARWFWDTLVDADLANNTLGWQWTAGCGADAAPYFRVFNPVAQGERFDPDGAYVRRWIPELARMSVPWIHKPWQAPAAALQEAGVELGRTLPKARRQPARLPRACLGGLSATPDQVALRGTEPPAVFGLTPPVIFAPIGSAMSFSLFINRLLVKACLWLPLLIVATQSGGMTVTGEIKVSTFSSDGETAVGQDAYLFRVSMEGQRWSMRLEYGDGYYELNGSDGSKTWTVNCSSDAELKKVFGARVNSASYPATVALVPCPFAATSAGQVVWLAFASSSIFATNSSPFIPELWGAPLTDPIANAIETSRVEFIEGSPRLPSRLEFLFSSRKLLRNPRSSPYLSTSIPESTIKSQMAKVKAVEGHRIGLYTVSATTNFEGETLPLSFQLDVFARDPAKKRQMYLGTVRSIAGTNSLEFLAERLPRGLSVQDLRFRDQSRGIDMIRYPMTSGFWLETSDPALLKLMQEQQAAIIPTSKGTTRAGRVGFAMFVAASLSLLVFLLRNKVRRSAWKGVSTSRHR